MKNVSYIFKYVIVFVLGVLSVSLVYAVSNVLSSKVIYDNSNEVLSSTDVQGAIDELADMIDSPTSCLDGYLCERIKTTLAPGDYVSYTPSGPLFTPESEKTNYVGARQMDPSELNLWRVLNINSDGTVDIISEYVTNENVYFEGMLGYQNFVGYLNELASKYETEGITVRSRHFGYSNATLYITNSLNFGTFRPWPCNTGGSCNPVESMGGGDTGYLIDYNLVLTSLGTVLARNVGTGNFSSYWIASRFYSEGGARVYYFSGRIIEGSMNSIFNDFSNYVNIYYVDNSMPNSNPLSAFPIRPIVTLSSELSYEGLGTKLYPMEIKG